MRPENQGIAEQRGAAGPARSEERGRLAAITMPAAEAYVAFARTATAHLGGALGLSVGRVADLGLAVNEACGQFLKAAEPRLGAPAVPLELRFDRTPETLRITVRGPIPGEWPDRDGLGWLVLDALVADAHCKTGPPDGIGTVTFTEPITHDA